MLEAVTQALPASFAGIQREVDDRMRRIPTRLNSFGYDPWGFHPESAKSAFVGRALVVEHVAFCVRRVSAIAPERPDPSAKSYVSCPDVHESNRSVAVPTGTPFVTGGPLKLPPTFR